MFICLVTLDRACARLNDSPAPLCNLFSVRRISFRKLKKRIPMHITRDKIMCAT